MSVAKNAKQIDFSTAPKGRLGTGRHYGFIVDRFRIYQKFNE